MDHYQSVMLADYVARERRAELCRAAARWHLAGGQLREPTPRETLAVALIALATWLAPHRSAVSRQPSALSPIVSLLD